jgi:hypothetical protein
MVRLIHLSGNVWLVQILTGSFTNGAGGGGGEADIYTNYTELILRKCTFFALCDTLQ